MQPDIREHISQPHFIVSSDLSFRRYRGCGAHIIYSRPRDLLLALFKELQEFTNRRHEIESVFSNRDTFTVFYGPFGCGKSALLAEIEAQAKKEKNWNVRRIARYRYDPQHLGENLGWRGMYLLDGVEDSEDLLMLLKHIYKLAQQRKDDCLALFNKTTERFEFDDQSYSIFIFLTG